MNPNRVVIDTNVFISPLLNPLGTPKKVINIAVSQFTILQSEATYREGSWRGMLDLLLNYWELMKS